MTYLLIASKGKIKLLLCFHQAGGYSLEQAPRLNSHRDRETGSHVQDVSKAPQKDFWDVKLAYLGSKKIPIHLKETKRICSSKFLKEMKEK